VRGIPTGTSLGRLTDAHTTGSQWGQAFSYDGFGNLTAETATKGSPPNVSHLYDPATNRLTDAGTGYDANGNLTAMPGLTMTYNVENRLTQATNTLFTQTDNYGYDAAGLRLWKQGPDGVIHVFYNGPDGKPLADFYFDTGNNGVRGGAPMVYFAGKRVDNGSVEDRLGTAVVEGGTNAMAYFPYGEQRSGTASEVQFATYKRDSTTNLDYAHHCYYSSQIGRFLTTDPAPPDPTDPQSWNRYSYTGGDPVNGNDPTGLCYIEDDCRLASQDGGHSGGGEWGGGGEWEPPFADDPNSPFAELCWDTSYTTEGGVVEDWTCMSRIPLGTVSLPNCNDLLKKLMSDFLARHHSPVLSKDKNFVSEVLAAAKSIEVDPRLFIAETAESNYGTSDVALNGNDPFGLKGSHGNLTFSTKEGGIEGAIAVEENTLDTQVNQYRFTVSQMYSGLRGVLAPPRGWTWSRYPAYCQGRGCKALGEKISGDMKSMGGDPNKLAYPSGQVGSIKCK
jgi:RHS repeat-associated protein